jgi:Tfp pilus assembly protein PilF
LARSAYPDAKGIATPKLVELRIGLLQRAFPNALSEPAPVGAAAALLVLYIVAFCAGGLGLGYVVYNRAAESRPQLAEAEEYYVAGDLVAAIVTAKQALDKDPENAALHAALSVYLYRAGSPDEAAVHARRTMLLQPRDPIPYFVLGSIACDGGDADAASAQLRAMRANVRSRTGTQYETELEKRIGAMGTKPSGSEGAAPRLQ